jgi:hypothetical protein
MSRPPAWAVLVLLVAGCASPHDDAVPVTETTVSGVHLASPAPVAQGATPHVAFQGDGKGGTGFLLYHPFPIQDGDIEASYDLNLTLEGNASAPFSAFVWGPTLVPLPAGGTLPLAGGLSLEANPGVSETGAFLLDQGAPVHHAAVGNVGASVRGFPSMAIVWLVASTAPWSARLDFAVGHVATPPGAPSVLAPAVGVEFASSVAPAGLPAGLGELGLQAEFHGPGWTLMHVEHERLEPKDTRSYDVRFAGGVSCSYRSVEAAHQVPPLASATITEAFDDFQDAAGPFSFAYTSAGLSMPLRADAVHVAFGTPPPTVGLPVHVEPASAAERLQGTCPA